jgi:DNA-binding NarL/FixJ family response regulator
MAFSDAAPTRVMVVDDHQTFAELLSGALDREPDLTSVGSAASGGEAVEMSRSLRPDLVMMDVQLPDMDGFAATEQITLESPWTRVIMLTAHTDPAFVLRAARAGACAFLPKDGSLHQMLTTIRAATLGGFLCAPELTAAVQRSPWDGRPTAPLAVPPGGAPVPVLTQREQDVLGLLAEGLQVRDVAERLGITEVTCRGYVKGLLVKLDAHSQLQAVVAAWRYGILPLRRDA